MRWVTWEQVGVDRMACAWLIRRSVDAEAEFLFVPQGRHPLPEGAEPFDIPGVRLSHHQGHCTFHTLLRAHGLADDPALARIARMVDEADTVQEVALEPSAPGLDLICRGLRRISPDDQTALARGALVYEALYAQLASEASPGAVYASPPDRDTPPPVERPTEVQDRAAGGRREGDGGAPSADDATR